MKIAVNALSATIGGGVTYLQNLIPVLTALDKSNDYYLFVAEENFEKIFDPAKLTDSIVVVKIKKYNLLGRLLQEQIYIPYLTWKYKIDILFCPANIVSFFAPCKKVLGILNIYPYVKLDMKEEPLVDKIRMVILRFLTSLSISFSSQIIYISDFSLELILSMVRSKREKHIRIYLGADSNMFYKTDTDILNNGDNYILSVSSISKRKNYAVLMRAFNLLKAELQQNYKIVLVGHISDELKSYLLDFVSDEKLRERIIFKGKVDLEELGQIYQKASLFVLPSLVEGFGLPVIEAMAAGIPVIVADATSLPEIAGEAGLRFEPQSPEHLSQQITKVLSDQTLASEMSLRGMERAKSFTWKRTAEETLASFSRLKNK